MKAKTLFTRLTWLITASLTVGLAAGAQAYDGTQCQTPGDCWEPKPGYPEKVAGSKYDPKHDPEEINKQSESHQGHGGAQRQARRASQENRQI